MEREYRATRSTLPEDHDPFEERIERDPLRLFDHWALFDNIFPYDAIADAHHILVARRKFADPLEMSPEERRELDLIKQEVREDYDAFIENFPRIQSVPGRLHFHLVVWKRR